MSVHSETLIGGSFTGSLLFARVHFELARAYFFLRLEKNLQFRYAITARQFSTLYSQLLFSQATESSSK